MPAPFTDSQVRHFCQQHGLAAKPFLAAFHSTYLPLSQLILQRYRQQQPDRCLLVALNAPQGSGKTTLCQLMQAMLAQEDSLNVITISIDDFYKTRAERQQTAIAIHPLFTTRGVPGTHDLDLAQKIILQLVSRSPQAPITIPRFNKASDDRQPSANWTVVVPPVDIIFFEGWCVGSQPQSNAQLQHPVNLLETEQDSDGRWRHAVNQFLSREYQTLFAMFDMLIYLSAPNFQIVEQWRWEQEEKLISKLSANNLIVNQTMSREALNRFMQHFERLTQHNFRVMPRLADIVIALDTQRRPLRLK